MPEIEDGMDEHVDKLESFFGAILSLKMFAEKDKEAYRAFCTEMAEGHYTFTESEIDEGLKFVEEMTHRMDDRLQGLAALVRLRSVDDRIVIL